MTTALILSGGAGKRMGIDCPKQYLEILGRPVIEYSLRVFSAHKMIDRIMIVAAEQWRGFIDGLIGDGGKFAGYADPGESRQNSVFNGLKEIGEKLPGTDRVIIHDAARPVLTAQLITSCLKELDGADGVMPALPMKDTCYRSGDGKRITGFLPRSELFAGQTPEAFSFIPYLELHYRMTDEEIKNVSGSSEIAFKNGMDVHMIRGDERNIKVTTKEDLPLVEKYLSGEIV